MFVILRTEVKRGCRSTRQVLINIAKMALGAREREDEESRRPGNRLPRGRPVMARPVRSFRMRFEMTERWLCSRCNGLRFDRQFVVATPVQAALDPSRLRSVRVIIRSSVDAGTAPGPGQSVARSRCRGGAAPRTARIACVQRRARLGYPSAKGTAWMLVAEDLQIRPARRSHRRPMFRMRYRCVTRSTASGGNRATRLAAMIKLAQLPSMAWYMRRPTETG